MNDDGSRRGDRAGTGKLGAQRNEGGEGVEEDSNVLEDADMGDLTIHDATDPDLGLTDVGDVGPDDWAANTGPTRTGEAEPHGVSNDLARDNVNVDGQRVEFDRPARKRK